MLTIFSPDPPNPTALYPLNSKFGTSDLSSNQNAAGIPFNVQLAPGPNGEADSSYQFSGNSSSYIEFPNAGGLDTRKSLTLLAWLFPENSDGPIFNYGTNYFGVHFWVANDKLFARIVSRVGFFAAVLISNTWSLNKWHFVGTSYDYDSGIQKLWLDGKVYDRQNIGTFEIDTQAAVRMGAMIGDNRVLKGRISCMQVYNKALTENEVHAARGICSERGWCALVREHIHSQEPITRSFQLPYNVTAFSQTCLFLLEIFREFGFPDQSLTIVWDEVLYLAEKRNEEGEIVNVRQTTSGKKFRFVVRAGLKVGTFRFQVCRLNH